MEFWVESEVLGIIDFIFPMMCGVLFKRIHLKIYHATFYFETANCFVGKGQFENKP